MSQLKRHDRLGKYRIERKVGHGGYATVYQAYDTVEGIQVALKIPRADFITKDTLAEFRREVRLVARLDHPNVLPIKNADFVDGIFVIVTPLGNETLAERLTRRCRLETALQFASQLLDAVAYAHANGVIHCDIKPDNLLLFGKERLRLADFGIAKVAQHQGTLTGQGTGTIGYLAPEQAFGRPSARSDVFSTGLILYRLVGGQLPTWPYAWPPPGFERVKQNVSGSMIAVIRRAIIVDHRKRFADGQQFLRAFQRVRTHALRPGRRKRQAVSPSKTWKSARAREFLRRFGTQLSTKFDCSRCGHPLSEVMHWCPWCGRRRSRHRASTDFPRSCKRCGRGIKADWSFCAWCYGGKVQEPSERQYSDVRYVAKCSNRKCGRKDLMPFMRYCPWCRTKVTRSWPVEGGEKCQSCGWGVAGEYWRNCPWCSRLLVGKSRTRPS
jgi:serine/threonine-protein kinase